MLFFSIEKTKNKIARLVLDNKTNLWYVFLFSCNDSAGTFIFTDEIFKCGQIRPIFPTFNQSLLFTSTQNNDAPHLRPPLKKMFVQRTKMSNLKLSCISNYLHNDNLKNMTLVEMEALNEFYEKSNSTGLSNVLRFRRYLKLQSNNDHKYAFVFFNPPMLEKSNKEKVENIVWHYSPSIRLDDARQMKTSSQMVNLLLRFHSYAFVLR